MPRIETTGIAPGTCSLMSTLGTAAAIFSIWLIRLAMFALGLGMGFMIMSQQAAAFAQISPADTANASAIYSMLRQTSSAVGVAVLATVLKVRLPAAGRDAAPADQIGAYHAAFLVAAALAAVSVVLAATVRDRDAAATMRSPTTPEDVPRAVPAEV